MDYTGITALLSIFVIAPGIVFGFILLGKKMKQQVELAQYRNEALALEVRKEELRIESLREENRKLDRMIEHKISDR